MRRAMIGLTVALTFCGCDRASESMPSTIPPAQIAPERQAVEQTAAQQAPEKQPEQASPEASGKGVGAAGCATPECESACKGKEGPECAEAYAIGCFSDAPPDDARCSGFAEKATPPKPRRKTADPIDKKPKGKGGGVDIIEAKATPVGD